MRLCCIPDTHKINMPDAATVLLVDDQPIVREGCRRVIESDDALSVVAECGRGDEALDHCRQHRPDVVLLEARLPDADGLDVAGRLLDADAGPRVLMFSASRDCVRVMRSLKLGVHGYLSKCCHTAVLLQSIHAVLAGATAFDPTLLPRAPRRDCLPGNLTVREREVFSLLVAGHTVAEVAYRLQISAKTAGVHQTRIMHKLGVRTPAQLVRLAVQYGLV